MVTGAADFAAATVTGATAMLVVLAHVSFPRILAVLEKVISAH